MPHSSPSGAVSRNVLHKWHSAVSAALFISPCIGSRDCFAPGLTLTTRNSSEIFYARGGRLSFYTAKTQRRHGGCPVSYAVSAARRLGLSFRLPDYHRKQKRQGGPIKA